MCPAAVTGTGTNACYLENLDKVGTWTGDQHEPKKVSTTTRPIGRPSSILDTFKGVARIENTVILFYFYGYFL